MITLGIGKIIFGQQKESSQAFPRALPPALLQTLLEVVAWCSARSLPGGQLRSPELDPSTILEIPSHELGIDEWIKLKRESCQKAVSAINETRSALLCGRDMTTSDMAVQQLQGKVLLYEPLETVTDGAAEASSRSFFDISDAPPWDTWFWYSQGAIFSWVPEPLVQDAQAGIDANPVDCIHWIDFSELCRL
jgi:hypothetical protein